jgi:hypothetical protein
LRLDVVKNSMAAASSKEGEFDTSTTTDAPTKTSVSPWPVSVLTPDESDAGTASCPCALSFLTSFDPMRPLPPMTTIFMLHRPRKPSIRDRQPAANCHNEGALPVMGG